MPWPFENRISNLAFGLALVILVAISLYSYRTTIEFEKTARWKGQTQEAIQTLSGILTLLTGAESGRRGFLITGKPEQLQTYYDAIERIQPEIGKAQLERALQPVVDFQKNYGVHVYIGEFSAIRWAPDNSAYRYLKDLIDIFEAHDWDWTYHAFREWSGWSVEHGPDPKDNKPAAQPTDRQKLLLEWFSKNHKPKWYRTP